MSLYKTLFETQENKLKVGIGGMIIITLMLAGVFSYEAGAVKVISLEDIEVIQATGIDTKAELIEFINKESTDGNSNENSQKDVTVNIPHERLLQVSCELTWTDEPSSYFQGTNEPDEFGVFILNSAGDEVANSGVGTTGNVQVSTDQLDYEQKDFKDNYVGEWKIVVECGDCGDDYSRFGFRSTPDTGNAWSLEINYKYLDESKE